MVVFFLFIQSLVFFIFILFNLDFFFRKRGKAFSIIERESAPLYSNEKIFQGRENLSLIGIIV